LPYVSEAKIIALRQASDFDRETGSSGIFDYEKPLI